jgi:hypothetical protein
MRGRIQCRSTTTQCTDPVGIGDSLAAGRSHGLLQALIQRLEQDLSPGQGDVGAFETNQRSGALGHLRGNEITNVYDETKSARLEKNAAACDRKIGRHDSLDCYRYRYPR